MSYCKPIYTIREPKGSHYRTKIDQESHPKIRENVEDFERIIVRDTPLLDSMENRLFSDLKKHSHSFQITPKKPQVVVPSQNISLLVNLLSEDASQIRKFVHVIVDNLSSNTNHNETVKIADELTLAFSLAKRIYGENTMNYEIYDKIHEMLIYLLDHIKSKKRSVSLRHANQIASVIDTLTESREEAKKLGIKPVILQYTGKKIGEMRVFQVK